MHRWRKNLFAKVTDLLVNFNMTLRSSLRWRATGRGIGVLYSCDGSWSAGADRRSKSVGCKPRHSLDRCCFFWRPLWCSWLTNYLMDVLRNLLLAALASSISSRTIAAALLLPLATFLMHD